MMLWLAAMIPFILTEGGDEAKSEPKMLKVGEPAPNFEGVNQDGKKLKLADFKGKWVILAFFVKAKTPG